MNTYDRTLEAVLRGLAHGALCRTLPLTVRSGLWKVYTRLHARRRPERVREMEHERGLR